MARLSRARRIGAGIASVALGAALLSSCGTGGAVANARLACKQVDRSLATYRLAQATTDPSERASLLHKAQGQLVLALAPASAATSADGSFNALMTDISESTRVPESYLVTSLQNQCKVVLSTNPYLGT